MVRICRLRGVNYDRRGNWTLAHQIVQDEADPTSAWVHAYLHRREGDLSNAHHWYRRSGRSRDEGSLDREREQITRSLLRSLVAFKWIKSS